MDVRRKIRALFAAARTKIFVELGQEPRILPEGAADVILKSYLNASNRVRSVLLISTLTRSVG
jgi:hypothetical protein